MTQLESPSAPSQLGHLHRVILRWVICIVSPRQFCLNRPVSVKLVSMWLKLYNVTWILIITL